MSSFIKVHSDIDVSDRLSAISHARVAREIVARASAAEFDMPLRAVPHRMRTQEVYEAPSARRMRAQAIYKVPSAGHSNDPGRRQTTETGSHSPTPSKPKPPEVFLSYSHTDKAFVKKLESSLSESGMKIRIDDVDLRTGDSLVERLAVIVKSADFVVAVLSHASVNSRWVTTELKYAMNEEITEGRIKVLPILIEPCELPPFLGDKLFADFSAPHDYDVKVAKLVSDIRDHSRNS